MSCQHTDDTHKFNTKFEDYTDKLRKIEALYTDLLKLAKCWATAEQTRRSCCRVPLLQRIVFWRSHATNSKGQKDGADCNRRPCESAEQISKNVTMKIRDIREKFSIKSEDTAELDERELSTWPSLLSAIINRCSKLVESIYFKNSKESTISEDYETLIESNQNAMEVKSRNQATKEKDAIQSELKAMWKMERQILLISAALVGTYVSIVLAWILYFCQFGIDIVPYVIQDPINQAIVVPVMMVPLAVLAIISHIFVWKSSSNRKRQIGQACKKAKSLLDEWDDPLDLRLKEIRNFVELMNLGRYRKLARISAKNIKPEQDRIKPAKAPSFTSGLQELNRQRDRFLCCDIKHNTPFISWFKISVAFLICISVMIIFMIVSNLRIACSDSSEWFVTSLSSHRAEELTLVGTWGPNMFVTTETFDIAGPWQLWNRRKPEVSVIPEDIVVCRSDDIGGLALCRALTSSNGDDGPEQQFDRQRYEHLVYGEIEAEMGNSCGAVKISDAFRFEWDKDELSKREKQRVRSFLRRFTRSDVEYVTVFGFSSPDGPVNHNLGLSERRAKGVAKLSEDYLATLQFNVRVWSHAFGEVHLTQGIANSRSVWIGVCVKSNGR